MGNTGEKTEGREISIQLNYKEIILHYPYKIKLMIGYSATFPHSFEGLKLWDANILIARHIVMNTHKFKRNSVL